MPLKLQPAIEKTFTLEKTDKFYETQGEPTTVTIRQATQGQHDRREGLWAEFTRSITDDGNVEVTQKVSPADIRRLEVMLTLRSSNLEDVDGSILFKEGMRESDFLKAWSKLPLLIADEIHEKVLEVNLLWAGTSGEAS